MEEGIAKKLHRELSFLENAGRLLAAGIAPLTSVGLESAKRSLETLLKIGGVYQIRASVPEILRNHSPRI